MVEVAEVQSTEPMLVHPILTTDQAMLVHQALITYLNQPEGSISEDPAEEVRVKGQVQELTLFFSEVVDHPDEFGLRGEREILRIVRAQRAALKGPAQPKRNKRKRAQARRQSYKKRTRAEKKAEAEEYNRARAVMEAEEKEAEDYWVEEQERKIARFEALGKKEKLTNEEVQELLELFGSPEGAERMRELLAGEDPQARLDAAKEAADAGGSLA